MEDKYAIAKNWLPRYTGMQPDEFGDYILLTNFKDYLTSFCEKFDIEPMGQDKPMPSATNKDGLSIINFGIGSPNAALVMDLLYARNPKGVLFAFVITSSIVLKVCMASTGPKISSLAITLD